MHARHIGTHKSAKFHRFSTHTPRDKSTSGSYYGVTVASTLASMRTFGDTLTGNDGSETRAGTWRIRDLLGHTSLPSFVALARILREISATSGSYYRVTRPIHGQVSVHSATLSPETMALRRVLELCSCVTHRDTQVCQVSSL
ncbi:hypothetical protein DPMN_186613 [Dreissena polymorpha]|uniref:Uncharacterized protein n=1 Tax=Dreissena polymorpha TaxID=45954 RepID=A0A9D4I8B7_DREPO|nr:hypothetical protein DPMN_186613 [Dreissena polymorpha]